VVIYFLVMMGIKGVIGYQVGIPAVAMMSVVFGALFTALRMALGKKNNR